MILGRELIKYIDTKPASPKNGDRYRNKAKQIFEFRYGRWIPIKAKNNGW